MRKSSLSKSVDPLVDATPLADLQNQADGLRSRLHQAIARMPSHLEFIEHNCKAA